MTYSKEQDPERYQGYLPTDEPEEQTLDYIKRYLGVESIANQMLKKKSVTTDKIGDFQVVNSKIGDLEITTDKIADLQIVRDKIMDKEVVGWRHIEDYSITTELLDNFIIGYTHLDKTSENRILMEYGDIGANAIDDSNIQDEAIYQRHLSPDFYLENVPFVQYGGGGRIEMYAGNMSLYDESYNYSGVIERTYNGRGITIDGYNNLYLIGGTARLELEYNNVYCYAITENTTTQSPNMFIEGNGLLQKSTSARKYKDEERVVPLDEAYNVLKVEPKKWIDKFSRKENIPGVVAEDVEAAGLPDYVVYGDEGQIEGVMYDRLWTLLIPLVQDLDKRMKLLEEKQ